MQWLIIGVGAAIGAMARAWLARFNGWHAWLPFGTLMANVVGGLMMGIALAYSDRLGPTWRPFVTTGFLGGLTTFSTFSAETFTLLNAGRLWSALVLMALHLGLTLGATAVGFYVSKTVG